MVISLFYILQDKFNIIIRTWWYLCFTYCKMKGPQRHSALWWWLLKTIVSYHKTHLVMSNGELLIYSIVVNGSLGTNVVSKIEVFSHSNNKILQMKPFIMHRNAQSYVTRVLCNNYSLKTSMTNWVKIFPGSLFYDYVGIHHVRILVLTTTKSVQCVEWGGWF